MYAYFRWYNCHLQFYILPPNSERWTAPGSLLIRGYPVFRKLYPYFFSLCSFILFHLHTISTLSQHAKNLRPIHLTFSFCHPRKKYVSLLEFWVAHFSSICWTAQDRPYVRFRAKSTPPCRSEAGEKWTNKTKQKKSALIGEEWFGTVQPSSRIFFFYFRCFWWLICGRIGLLCAFERKSLEKCHMCCFWKKGGGNRKVVM